MLQWFIFEKHMKKNFTEHGDAIIFSEKIDEKLRLFILVLEHYKKSADLFKEYQELYTLSSTQENQQLYTIMRDSMIQRFKRSVIFLWKILTIYLQDIESICFTVSPRKLIRKAVNARVLSESQGIKSMDMINVYNQISLIYDTITPDDI